MGRGTQLAIFCAQTTQFGIACSEKANTAGRAPVHSERKPLHRFGFTQKPERLPKLKSAGSRFYFSRTDLQILARLFARQSLQNERRRNDESTRESQARESLGQRQAQAEEYTSTNPKHAGAQQTRKKCAIPQRPTRYQR